MSLGVLLVEDDRELRATLCEALRVEGYRVVASASLADARAALSAGLKPSGLALKSNLRGLMQQIRQAWLGQTAQRRRAQAEQFFWQGRVCRRPKTRPEGRMDEVVPTRTEAPGNSGDSMDKAERVLSMELSTGGHGYGSALPQGGEGELK